MATIIDELISRLGFDITGKENLRDFKRGMSDAEKQAKGFAGSITQLARGVTTGMAAIGTAVAGATAGMFKLANAAAGPLDDLVKAADRAGVSVEALQELGFVAEQSGSSVTEMSNAVEMMSRRLAEAARGQGRAKTALEAYGLSATDAAGNVKNATDFMSELADTFQGLSEAERLDLGQQLGLSRGLITMLAQGNDEIERLRQVARDAGVIFTEEDARNAEAYNDAMNLLMRSVRAMRDRIAIDLLPTLMQMIAGMQDWLQANREIIQQNVGALLERIARHARTLSERGSEMVQALRGWEPLLIGLARVLFPTAFAIGLLAVAFDEFMTWWNGEGESFLGRFSDWLQSIGASEGVADTITGIALALGLFALLKPAAFLAMVGGLGRLLLVVTGLKGIGAGAVLTGAGAGLATIAGISASKLFLIAAGVWAIYAASKALAGIGPMDNAKRFLEDVAPPQTQEEKDKVIREGPVGFLGEAVGNFLARGPLGRLLTEGAQRLPSQTQSEDSEGSTQRRPLSPFDPRPEFQPQSFGTQPGESFSPAIGGGVTDNRNQSTNVDVGGINVSVGGGADGRSIASEITDALNRRINIHGASPATP